jgi:hypothetical protein
MRGWALLGTSRYLSGDLGGALDAWNRDRGPVLEVVTVSGLRRTRHPVVHDVLGLRPGDPLEAGAFGRARRRLGALPSAEVTSITYRALPGSRVEVQATAIERTLLPRGTMALAGLLLPALATSELRVRLPSVTGGGESALLFARWSRARAGVGGALDAPGVAGFPGVTHLGVSWERERHAGDGTTSVEARTGARIALTDWSTEWLRWEIGGGVDRWRGRDAVGVLRTALELSAPGDRVDLLATLEGAAGGDDGAPPGYLRWRVVGSARPLPEASRWRLDLRALAAGVGEQAPRMLWPGADAGSAREGLLRAHRMERDGALSGETLGTGLLNATVELERRVWAFPLGGLGVAAFADAARVTRPSREGGRPSAPDAAAGFIDAGIGLRLDIPLGRLRADVATGSDGSRALSLGWLSRRNRDR